ncbi:MAG: sensor histidine kinase KdpD [Anaerolineaceae bacterium]|nr:sensor histidine kinase KdpD [Anaerolineaceae bacterium]
MDYNKSMCPEYQRPDPDKLLAQIQADEAKANRGKLKIFLGYVAGVGKTYAMLEAAHQRMDEGVDVVVGYAETHSRKETETLLEGLEILPRHQVDYRGTTLTEMDLDGILARHPQLVLVDELAHTNAPGSRHPKRYMDVEELLNAGIDVYSTVNIQHLESLVDVVQQITGVIVREKIPDRLLDEADEIELIDLPTNELLQRLKDGKVYISDQAMRALEKFFRKGNLTALRELSLRRAANRVDNQMLNYMQHEAIAGPWPAAEHILVCISSHPLAERLIRSGKRLAEDLNAEWYVLFVETPQHLKMPADNRARVQHFFALAEELGAKVVSVTGESVADEVLKFSREHNVTKIIAGKPFRPRLVELIRGSVIDQIIRGSGPIDVYVVSDGLTHPQIPTHKPGLDLTPHRPLWRYLVSMVLVGLVSLIGVPLSRFLDPTNLVMVYLLAVVFSAVYLGRGPAILASILSVLCFDFFFIDPTLTFTVYDTQYLITFTGLLLVGLIISSSAALLRDQVDAMRRKDQLTQALLGYSRELTGAINLEQVLKIAVNSVSNNLNRENVILLPANNTLEVGLSSPNFVVNADELAVAEWAFKHNQAAGHGTDTLPATSLRFTPLLTSHGPVGILGIKAEKGETSFSMDQRMQLEGVANLTALALERALLAKSAAQTEMLKNTEKLQSALLNSISHELRTPLSSITGVLTTLVDSENNQRQTLKMDADTRMDLLISAIGQARNLNLLVENLLNMTRIEAGSVHLNMELVDLQDLIGSVLQQYSARLHDREVKVDLSADLPLINCDTILIAQVLANLIDNACKYSPEKSPIIINATLHEKEVEVKVRDYGSSLPQDEVDRVFDKFFRGAEHKSTTGTGLGLSICKGIIETHGGRIKAENNPDKGMTFSFTLPIVTKAKTK